MTGYLTLHADPTNNLHAATKQYVDSSLTNLNASNLTQGTIPVERLPSFTGDVTSSAGSNTLTLSNSGVIPGTYTKITVDGKGRVTVGTILSATDIPNLDASKITTGTLDNTRTTGTSANTANTLVLRDTSGNFSAGTITATLSGNASTASALQTARTISATGDAIWSVSFDGSANVSGTLTLSNSGVIAGSYGSASQVGTFTVDAKGRITNANNTNIAINASQVTAGTFDNARISQGNVTQHQAALSITEGQIVNGSLLARVGDAETITGSWTFNSPVIIPNPTTSNHAATKQYVDQAAEGLKSKPAVEIIVTKPADIAALGSFTYNNGTNGVGATLTKNGNGAWPTIDGVLLTSTTMGENGVLIAFPNNTANAVYNGRYNLTQVGDNNNPWILTRCGLCDEGNEIPGSYTFVKRGTTYAGTGWVQVQGTDVDTDGYLDVGTDQIWLFQFSGAGTYTAGTGLSLNGTQFNVNLGAGIVELPGDEVGIHLYSPTAGGLILTTDGSGRSSDTNAMLHLLLKTNGGLTQDADGLYIPAGGVSNAMLANSTFTVNGDNGSDVVNLGETILFAGTAAQGISTTITNNTVTISAANASSSQKGVASFAAGDFDVTAGHVTIKAGGVDNAQLAHSTITVGGDTGTPDAIALGQSLSVVGGTSHISTSMNDVTNTLSISFDSPFEGLNDVQGTSSCLLYTSPSPRDS